MDKINFVIKVYTEGKSKNNNKEGNKDSLLEERYY